MKSWFRWIIYVKNTINKLLGEQLYMWRHQKHERTVFCRGRRNDNEAPLTEDVLGTGLNRLLGRSVGLRLARCNSATGAVRRTFCFGCNCDVSVFRCSEWQHISRFATNMRVKENSDRSTRSDLISFHLNWTELNQARCSDEMQWDDIWCGLTFTHHTNQLQWPLEYCYFYAGLLTQIINNPSSSLLWSVIQVSLAGW